MPVKITIQEFGENGRAESRRDYQVVGDNEYRQRAMPTLDRLSQAVEQTVDYHRQWIAKNQGSVTGGD
jgi:hypothetical protein